MGQNDGPIMKLDFSLSIHYFRPTNVIQDSQRLQISRTAANKINTFTVTVPVSPSITRGPLGLNFITCVAFPTTSLLCMNDLRSLSNIFNDAQASHQPLDFATVLVRRSLFTSYMRTFFCPQHMILLHYFRLIQS